MVSLFIAVYLYQQGYSLVFIFTYLACYYACKIPIAFVAAWLTARFGPKHTILFANLLYIPALILLTFVPPAGASHALMVIIFFATFQGVSATLYDYAYMVNFSKVKSVQHAGKELGYMHIIEKIASIISPIIGGVIATLLGPVVVMIVAACLFAVAAAPLLRTGEPTKLRQKIRWRGFPWRTSWRSIVASSGTGFDVVVSGVGWSLFLAAVAFAEQQEIYVIIGVLSAIGMGVAFIAAFTFGRLIDRRSGEMLLRYGVITKALMHMTRPVVGSAAGASIVSAGSEVTTTAYHMAFMRGMFDVADYSGFRLTYLLLVEMAVNIGAAMAALIGAVLCMVFEQDYAFMLFFASAAVVILVIATPRFAIYKP